MCGSKEFNVYVEPTRPITEEASEVNSLTKINDHLCYKAKRVQTVPIEEALQKFLEFLKNINKPVLVGHYSKKFHFPFMRFYLEQCDLWEAFLTEVKGFVDTWEIFREKFPGLDSYSQIDLVHTFTDDNHEACSAKEKVKELQELSEKKSKMTLLITGLGQKKSNICTVIREYECPRTRPVELSDLNT